MKKKLIQKSTVLSKRFAVRLNFGEFLPIDLESFYISFVFYNLKQNSFLSMLELLLIPTKNLLKIKPRFWVSCPGIHFKEIRPKSWLLPQKYSRKSFEYIMKHFESDKESFKIWWGFQFDAHFKENLQYKR